MVAIGALTTSSGAQRVPITGDRISGVVLPIEPIAADIAIQAARAEAWNVDDTKRLLLGGDVQIAINGYTFRSDSAAVWLNRIPSSDGLINQIVLYFDQVDEPLAEAGRSVRGKDVLVTASARGEVDLAVTILNRSKPADAGILIRGERRLADHLARTLAARPELKSRPQIDAPTEPPPPVPVPGGRIESSQLEPPRAEFIPAAPQQTTPLFVPGGAFHFHAGEMNLIPGEVENIFLLTNSIVVDYHSNDLSRPWSQLSLSAERGVVFTDPGSIDDLASGQVTADIVRGIYLEGNVQISADGGEYVARAPKVYYDVRQNRALMVDAILRTTTRVTHLPVYARAQELRQVAANQWEAKRVNVSTSEFLTPHLAIGAQRLTVTRRPDGDGGDETHLRSSRNTLQLGGVPFFYWPTFEGQIANIPLREIQVGTEDNDGLRIETTWDAISLLGVDRPGWVRRADVKIDGYTERGAGGGGELQYQYERSDGSIDLYGLYDEGVDRTSSGREVAQDHDFRGVALWEHELEIGRHWTLQAQTSSISDETYITTWRRNDFHERREYETSAYLKYQHRNSSLASLVKYDLNDFVSNDWLLASRGFSVDRVPDIAYRRYGDSLFDDQVTYSSDIRVTRSRFSFTRRTPLELGVPGAAFGIDDDVQLSDAARAAGLSGQFVNRFDTRHELSVPTSWGPFKLVPFAVGRLTFWDDDFEDFSSDSDDSRAFGAAGLRINGQFSHIDNGMDNRLLDLHRLRHIFEPRMTLWYGYATVDQTDLPPYDVDVESLATGAAVEFGARNTWQTQRGGPGRWRSVDVFTLDGSLVFNSSDVDRESPSPQFFDYRPEYSQFGDHAQWSAIWLASDTLALTGMNIYDLNESAIARSSVGAEIRHSPMLTTYLEYRYLDASDNQLLDVEWAAQLTSKYAVAIRPQWDFNRDKFRALRLRLTRSFPDFDFIAQVEFDDIRDDTTFGASLGRVEF